MQLHRAPRTLACLTLTLPTLVWAGFGSGKSSPLIWLFPVMLVVSAVALLVLVISLFGSGRTPTTSTYMVVAADVVAIVLMANSGDDLAVLFAWFLGIGAALLLFITVIVHAGEAMLVQPKTKQGSSRTPRQPPARGSD